MWAGMERYTSQANVQTLAMGGMTQKIYGNHVMNNCNMEKMRGLKEMDLTGCWGMPRVEMERRDY